MRDIFYDKELYSSHKNIIRNKTLFKKKYLTYLYIKKFETKKYSTKKYIHSKLTLSLYTNYETLKCYHFD